MGNEGVAPPFFSSELDGSDLSASRPCLLTPGETAPDTNYLEEWVGPIDDLDPTKKGKSGAPTRERDSERINISLKSEKTSLSIMNMI
jgi:hypothetical protein